MQDETVVVEFTRQAEAYNLADVVHAAATLDSLVAFARPQAGERWLEAACGPGVVARRLAPLVGEVHGVDLTPAMVELARREALAGGLRNATFEVGDATDLDLPAATFDGALARFAIHHVPVPARLVEELARVVRPGGVVVLADHVLDVEPAAAAWSQEIERLRDPSHWACLPPARLRALGVQAGLALEAEEVFPIDLDFDDWLVRGSAGPGAGRLVARALAERPDGTDSFRVREHDGRRRLELRVWRARWRTPLDG
jgi:SAM-dependent methyltransferase